MAKPIARFVYVLFRGRPDRSGHRWYWRLKSNRNGNTLCHSEGYAKPANVRHTVRRLVETHWPGTVLIEDSMPGRKLT